MLQNDGVCSLITSFCKSVFKGLSTAITKPIKKTPKSKNWNLSNSIFITPITFPKFISMTHSLFACFKYGKNVLYWKKLVLLKMQVFFHHISLKK